MSEEEVEPWSIENEAAAAYVEDSADETAALSEHEGQRLVSTQTVRHDYLTLSGKVMRETVWNNGTLTDAMDFIYDESGRPFALNYSANGTDFVTYYYILNLQGDVVGLTDASGTFVAQYTYNAWGEVLTATGSIAGINPLRYRGYYYDFETGFYYLQSRYYDPANHRFINADNYASTGQGFVGTNMFAYCGNNPTNASDPTGHNSSADSNANGIPDYLEERWRKQTIREKVNQIGLGNYLGYNIEDLYFIKTAIHYNISKEESVRFYEEISSSTTADVLGGMLGFVEGLGKLFGLVSLFESLSSYDYAGIHDPTGNLLYLEEGYTVAEIERIYIGTKWSAFEVEYVIFDENCTIVYNDRIPVSYLYD